tara:strand:+ start:132 stop:539 length:408 start_codon:yes stop_codon:yes gene_type:complete
MTNLNIWDTSSFAVNPGDGGGSALSDLLISDSVNQSPDFIKLGIEALFFNGQPISKLPDQEMADALVINALFRVQKDLFVEHGQHDIPGMLTAYHMPVSYEDAFKLVGEHGFIDAVEMTMREDGDFWENRGVSLN